MMGGTSGRALHLLDDVTGLRLLPAGGGPDAADLRLIDEAAHVSRVIDLTVGHALAA
jgi:phosphoribosylformimino-5-aminoimidazole carboxamide ribonucleotide (ProFAR) isomerase